MNFYESELKKVMEKSAILREQKYVGRACFGTVGKDIRARIEFVTTGTADQYEGIKTSII